MAIPSITADTQVNEVVRAFPATLPVFHAAGIDSCCGGALPLGEVANRHGLDVDRLLDELRAAADDSAGAEAAPA